MENMINPLIRNDASIDKLKLCGFDFKHDVSSRKLKYKFPHGLRYGDDILPCGYDNKGMVKDGLMIDVYEIEYNGKRTQIDITTNWQKTVHDFINNVGV